MPRTRAGKRYPYATTDARPHDHTFCGVAAAIARSAAAGAEDWGTPHPLVLPADATEDDARRIRRGIFTGRGCPRGVHGPLSVAVKWRTEDGGEVNGEPSRTAAGYVLVVRVWQRDAGKRELARRVRQGQELHYNVLRG